jgi:hypothetical protein
MLQEEIQKIKKLMSLVDEQEAEAPSAGATPSSGGGEKKGYPTVTKWDSGVTRGKANPIDQKSKWDSGVTRGKANQIAVTKWESGVKRGKGNTLL